MKSLLERLELPPEFNVYCEHACDYIVGYILFNITKKRIKFGKTKSADEIVTTHKLYKQGKELLSSGKQHLALKKISSDGDYGLVPKNKKLPTIGISIWETPDKESKVDGSYFGSHKWIHVNVGFNWKDTETDTLLNGLISEIRDTLKHELRHYYQFNNHSNFGFTKMDIRRNKMYKGADGKTAGSYEKLIHPLSPIEFKTNVYTYATHIKNYLNSNFSKRDWKNGFIELMSSKNTPEYLVYSMKRDAGKYTLYIRDVLIKVKNADPKLYRQYIIEIYKVIFRTGVL